jgi:transposase
MNYRSFIGIDVSKLTFDAHVHRSNQKKQFRNDDKGHLLFLKWLTTELKHGTAEMLVCFEHTGVYSLNLSLFLQKNRIPFVIVPALEIKRSLGITRGKNDQIDAQRIAYYAYLKRESLQPTVLPSKTILSLQPLLALRDKLVLDRAAYKTAAGEYKSTLKTTDNQYLIDIHCQMIKELTLKITAVEKHIHELVQKDEQIKTTYELITGIKGIGPLTAAYLIVCTHNFSRFQSWRKFACYAGIAPFEHRSGTSIRGRNKVSPLANKQIKTLLFLSANNAVRGDIELKEYYIKRVNEGKSKMSTLNIIKNKLVARVFAVAKRQTEFVNLRQFAA